MMKTSMKKLFVMLMFGLGMLGQTFAQDVMGSWKGELNVMGQSIPLVAHFFEENGGLSGKLDSPKQGAIGIVMKKVLFESGMLSFEVSVGNASYEGLIVGEEIKGYFSQGGMKLPLDLKKLETETSTPVIPSKVQDPKPPFPYDISDITFENQKENIILAGTLTKPQGHGPFPAVVLVSGSGPQNRDQEILGHKPFWVIADFLSRNGVVVLRYDERGVGQSTGDFSKAMTNDFKDDAMAGMDYLSSLPFVDKNKLGIIGHSEGGLVSWMVGAEYTNLGFVISLAGPVVKITDLMEKQTEDVVRSSGAPEEIVRASVNQNKAIYNLVTESQSEGAWKSQLRPVFETYLKELNVPQMTWDTQIRQLQQTFESQLTPWMVNFLKTNPETYIRNIKVPVFAAFGGKDVQINAASNAKHLQELFQSKPGLLELKVYEELNHLFQTANTGSILEYGQLEETFNEVVLIDMLNFILRQ